MAIAVSANWATLAEMFRPHAVVLAAAVILDLLLGDPVYPLHPIRLIGHTLTLFERGLRRVGADGYGGGVALFFLLAVTWVGGTVGLLVVAAVVSWKLLFAVEIFLAYSCLALRDLLKHSWAVERAARAGDLGGARVAIARLVGRDTIGWILRRAEGRRLRV